MEEEKKYYLTKEGLQKIRKEHEDLKKIKFTKTKGEAPKLLHSEDLNQEYLAFQEDMSFLESRLVELDHILKNTEFIKIPTKEKQNIIGLGATVTLEERSGGINEFTIVGTLEANPAIGKISNESPVGKTLLGHKRNDEVVISSPIKIFYKIKKIKYNLS
ncbi:GreA/GreB family elongation factor [Patescibacteria group bacterium]